MISRALKQSPSGSEYPRLADGHRATISRKNEKYYGALMESAECDGSTTAAENRRFIHRPFIHYHVILPISNVENRSDGQKVGRDDFQSIIQARFTVEKRP